MVNELHHKLLEKHFEEGGYVILGSASPDAVSEAVRDLEEAVMDGKIEEFVIIPGSLRPQCKLEPWENAYTLYVK
jgi:hypothetical protein